MLTFKFKPERLGMVATAVQSPVEETWVVCFARRPKVRSA